MFFLFFFDEFQIDDVDENMLALCNLENLTLSANLLTQINSQNLPRKLKVGN